MSTFGSAGGLQSVQLTGVTSPLISNVILTTATEYQVTLPTGTKRYLIKLRDDNVSLLLRFVSGSDYLTIPQGCHYSEDGLSATTIDLYVQAELDNQVLELVTWT